MWCVVFVYVVFAYMVFVFVCLFYGKLGITDAYSFPGLWGPDPFSTPGGDWDLFYKGEKILRIVKGYEIFFLKIEIVEDYYMVGG